MRGEKGKNRYFFVFFIIFFTTLRFDKNKKNILWIIIDSIKISENFRIIAMTRDDYKASDLLILLNNTPMFHSKQHKKFNNQQIFDSRFLFSFSRCLFFYDLNSNTISCYQKMIFLLFWFSKKPTFTNYELRGFVFLTTHLELPSQNLCVIFTQLNAQKTKKKLLWSSENSRKI